MRFSLGMVSLRLLAIAAVTLAVRAAQPAFDVREFGAVPDGTTLCTAALQQAIDRCAQGGGGTVCFPAGTYLAGTLVLKSHVTLHLEAGATLRGSADPKDYPVQTTAIRSYTDTYVRQALIYGEDLDGVGLEGAGTIDGSGGAFKWKEYVNRPYVIRLIKCRDVVVSGLTLRDSAMWMQHYLACDRVRVSGLRVFNHVAHNNDGLDLDGCHDVFVSDCVIDSDDDALCLKSTLDRACENVTVTNCVLSTHCNAFKLGTESNGGFRNITFSNSVILSPRFSQRIHGLDRGSGGIALELVDGGALENITITNVVIRGVNVPIFLRLGNRARPFVTDGPVPAMGTFRNVAINNIVATAAGRVGCSITGLPGHRMENVALSNLSLEFEGGGASELTGRPVPERAQSYPETRMFGDLPAYGFYCRHVNGLKITDVRLTTLQRDARHALVCDDVHDVEITGLNAPADAGAAALLHFRDVVGAYVHGSRVRQSLEAFLQIDGAATRDVRIAGNDFSNVRQAVQCAPEIPAAAIRAANNLEAK